MDNKATQNPNNPKKEGVSNTMVDLRFSETFIKEAEEKIEKLQNALQIVREKKADLEKDEAEILRKIQGIAFITGKSIDTSFQPQSDSRQMFSPIISKNLSTLSLSKACLEILKANPDRWFTANETVSTLEKAGRQFNGPNARDMTSGALRSLKQLVDRKRNGREFLYRLKKDSNLFIR